MLNKYKIWAYAYLVKVERYDLESVEGGTKPVVEEAYRIAVSEYLVTGVLPV